MNALKNLAIAGLFAASYSAHAISIVGPSVIYQGHTYTELSPDTWTASEAFAVANGGHLVAINDSAENAFLTSTFGEHTALWIGLYRTGPGSFGWSNGDALTYTNWAKGEPNNSRGNENYVHAYTNGTWNDTVDNSIYPGPKYGIMEIVSSVSVAEPATLGLMFIGFGLLGFVRRCASR